MNFGVVVGAIVIFSVSMEIALGVLGINTKSTIRFIDGKGPTRVPHAYYRHSKEGFSEGYFNAHGFRDYERTYGKPKGTFRILVFGDSYTEGLQVPLEKTFPALLEKKLNENSDSRKFEVLNFGQSGFGTADSYMRYLNFGVQYDPDLVLLAFYTGNDFRNNSRILNGESLAFYFSFDENENLVVDSSLIDEYQKGLNIPKRIFQAIKQKSYLASLLSERIFLLRQQSKANYIRERLQSDKEAGEGVLDEFSDLNIYLTKLAPLWKQAFGITEGGIQKFKNSVEQHGAKFVLVTLSNPEQIHFEIQQEVIKQHSVSFDFEQPDKFLEKFAIRNGVMFLKLLPVLKGYHIKTGRYLHGFDSSKYGLGRGHWNEIGHQIAAETIFEFLHEQHLIPVSVQNSLPLNGM